MVNVTTKTKVGEERGEYSALLGHGPREAFEFVPDRSFGVLVYRVLPRAVGGWMLPGRRISCQAERRSQVSRYLEIESRATLAPGLKQDERH